MPLPVSTFEERHASKIAGSLGCFDRVVLSGTFPDISHAGALTHYFYERSIRIFDLTQWAKPLADQLRTRAEALAAEHGLSVEYISKKNFRKEDRIAEILKARGDAPGLVHIFSAPERCSRFVPWHDKVSHRTGFKSASGKCTHFYFYFIDADLGLCFLRVPTWAPFRLQFYFNGHNLLARRLRRATATFTLQDNAFTAIDNFEAAQREASAFIDIRKLHRKLDQIVADYCPALTAFQRGIHWSISQLEYSVDLLFKKSADFLPLYQNLTRTAIHAIKPEHIATFLSRTVHPLSKQEMGGDLTTQIQGTRIKHFMGPVAIKLYDKFGTVARVECTANNVCFFKHHREVVHRDGTSTFKVAPVKKSIYSLPILAALMRAACIRYLNFLGSIDDPTSGLRNVEKISTPVRQDERSYRGFNLFDPNDLQLFHALSRGEFCISGFRARHVRAHMPSFSQSQITHLLKRLRVHGLIKKIGRTFKYYLTKLGTTAITAALKLRHLVVLPAFQSPSA